MAAFLDLEGEVPRGRPLRKRRTETSAPESENVTRTRILLAEDHKDMRMPPPTALYPVSRTVMCPAWNIAGRPVASTSVVLWTAAAEPLLTTVVHRPVMTPYTLSTTTNGRDYCGYYAEKERKVLRLAAASRVYTRRAARQLRHRRRLLSRPNASARVDTLYPMARASAATRVTTARPTNRRSWLRPRHESFPCGARTWHDTSGLASSTSRDTGKASRRSTRS
jgi:hypothetical protein